MPILRGGNTLGVLVVQNRARRIYTDEEVEALQTTAMLLAEMIASGELQAIALPGDESALKRPVAGRIYTDSQYVLKGISEWIHGWKRNGWKTSARQPVKNADLWQQLDALRGPHRLEWIWVKGHAGHPENERADALANRGIDELKETR